MPHSVTPAELGYRWPAEWEPHEATWLAWPHQRDTWPEKFEVIPQRFAELISTIARFEPVHVLAGRGEVFQQAQTMVGDVKNVTLWEIETDDAWTRDYMPAFLLHNESSQPAMVDWLYNAWGGKYPPWDRDNAVGGQIAQRLGMQRFTPGMVLEAGAIEGNGRGTILTTESCLLNPNRNPTMSRDVIEQYLREFCGAKKVLWLSGGGIAGDDTDGHIDQLARFVSPTTIVTALEEDTAEENYAPLQASFQQLSAMTDAEDRPLQVVPLPMPRPLLFNGQRLPASYCNFYICNGAVLVPQFNDPADTTACQTLAQIFPDREIVPHPAVDMVLGLGAFHCLTQQQPASGESRG